MPRPNPPRLLGREPAIARRGAFERKQRGSTTERWPKRMTDTGCPINPARSRRSRTANPDGGSGSRGGGFAKVFEMSLEERAIAPEIAANDTVRALVPEHQRLAAKKLRRDREAEDRPPGPGDAR